MWQSNHELCPINLRLNIPHGKIHLMGTLPKPKPKPKPMLISHHSYHLRHYSSHHWIALVKTHLLVSLPSIYLPCFSNGKTPNYSTRTKISFLAITFYLLNRSCRSIFPHVPYIKTRPLKKNQPCCSNIQTTFIFSMVYQEFQ